MSKKRVRNERRGGHKEASFSRGSVVVIIVLALSAFLANMEKYTGAFLVPQSQFQPPNWVKNGGVGWEGCYITDPQQKTVVCCSSDSYGNVNCWETAYICSDWNGLELIATGSYSELASTCNKEEVCGAAAYEATNKIRTYCNNFCPGTKAMINGAEGTHMCTNVDEDNYIDSCNARVRGSCITISSDKWKIKS
jgi:hypothetical protein